MSNTEQNEVVGEAMDVLSGDDLIILVDLGTENLYKKQRVRLRGVDAPDARGKGPSTVAGVVRDKVRQTIKRKLLKVRNIQRGVNGWIADVEYLDEPSGRYLSLNNELVAMGYQYEHSKRGK